MIKEMKKVFACTLIAALALGTVEIAAATNSPTIAVKPVAKKNVTAKSNGIVSKVDTKANGTATLKTVNKTSKKSVVVASNVTVNGVKYTVTTINAKAFANCKKATKITLPATIKTINKSAFTGLKKVKTITLQSKKSITIKKGAFKGLNTKNVTIKAGKMSKKELTKLKKTLKKAGFKGKIK